MGNKFEVGTIVEGKVTGIQPYGVFVSLDEETQGLVHISEITHQYVKNIQDHLKVGDEVKVKILAIDEDSGKISLSIRAAKEPPKRNRTKKRIGNAKKSEKTPAGFNTLKEKLQEWIEQSKREDLIKK
ncbi:S1 domain-containing post-transcriptional regulator GSP13 [Aeribacillus alveayuensis]|uniref:General stress protein 13 n=1 Tax=Aeribacillus alveayuensis TaxID=279215 RepID=A0ABT9VTE5_9BACI|nr:general stress protein 13 [Bacillus alveayuensis]